MRRSPRLSLLAACLAWVGCAAPAVESGAASSAGSAAAPAVPERPAAWRDMTHDQRRAYMQAAVLPYMEPLFLAHDAGRFEAFSCRTCHGTAARERAYRMPNPELPTLYPTGSAEQKATVHKHRAIARFMHQQVTPGIRKLLGAQAYDPATGTGFSCFHCHPRGEPAEAQAQGDAS